MKEEKVHFMFSWTGENLSRQDPNAFPSSRMPLAYKDAGTEMVCINGALFLCLNLASCEHIWDPKLHSPSVLGCVRGNTFGFPAAPVNSCTVVC